MMYSINPAVCRRIAVKWSLVAGIHLLGCILGGIAIFALASLLLAPLRDVALMYRLIGAAVVLVLAAIIDSDRLPVSVPSSRRQVPQRWRLGSAWSWSFGFGLGLGFFVLTRVKFAVMFAAAVFAALLVPAVLALVAGGVFGAARATVLLTARNATEPSEVVACDVRFRAREERVRSVVVGASLVLALGVGVAIALA